VELRHVSAKIFMNEYFVEVVAALGSVDVPQTAQDVARTSRIAHGRARDVLVRLVAARLVQTLPRTGGSRSELFFAPLDSPAWTALVQLARNLEAENAGSLRNP
jgi:hypothetical protein